MFDRILGSRVCPAMVIRPVDQLIIGLCRCNQESPRITSSLPMSVMRKAAI